MNYKYITENNLEYRQNYMYSEYEGKEFLLEMFATRHDKMNAERLTIKHVIEYVNVIDNEPITTSKLINIIYALKDKNYSREEADRYVKAFEVRKRLYNEYIDNSIKPSENSKYSNYINYILLAVICIMFYEHTDSLKYLNTLLKLDDTILSLYNMISQDDKNIFGYILRSENVYIKELIQKSCVDVEGVE